MPMQKKRDRKIELLIATHQMLKKIQESTFIISPFEITVHYDEADCDGSCLMMDIEDCLRECGIEINEAYRKSA
jgi:hypothetical protein